MANDIILLLLSFLNYFVRPKASKQLRKVLTLSAAPVVSGLQRTERNDDDRGAATQMATTTLKRGQLVELLMLQL